MVDLSRPSFGAGGSGTTGAANYAGFWRRIGSIVIPLAKNGFLSGVLLSFISIAKELDLIAILELFQLPF